MKIKITQHKDKWTISFGGTPSTRSNSTLIYRLLERRLSHYLTAGMKKLTSVIVKVHIDQSNETMDSYNAKYLLGATLAFLEDSLEKSFVKNRFKLYGHEINNY